MPLLTREECKTKLLHNIEIIKSLVPDFNITPEQIEKMTSQERYDVYVAAQNVPTAEEKIAKANAEIRKYCVPECLPGAMQRNKFHMVRYDGSKDSDEYNKKLFTNINRDDEIGTQVRLNYTFEALGTLFKLDADRLLEDMTPMEMLNYVREKEDLAGTAMEIEHFIVNSDIKVKPEFSRSWQAARIFGASVGGIIRDYTKYAKMEQFMTMPFAFMDQQQLMVLMGKISAHKAPKYFDDDINAVGNYANFEILYAGCKEDIRKFNEVVGKKPFSLDEFEYRKDIKNRCVGGISKRIELIKEGINNIRQIPGFAENAEVSQFILDYETVLNTIQTSPDLYDKNINKTISDRVTQMRTSIKNYLDANRSKEAAKQLCSALEKTDTLFAPFAANGYIPEQLGFEKEDLKIADINAAARKSVRDYQEYIETFNYEDSYGETQVFSEADLMETRTRIAVALSDLSKLEEQNQGRNFEVNQFLKINRENLQKQSLAFNHAAPGMSLDQIIQNTARAVELPPQLAQALNGSYDGLNMTITGPDGSMQQGVFTTADPRIDLQNVAVSDMAHLLGADNIIEKSSRLTLANDGLPTQGTFTEKAIGEDPVRITSADSPFFKLKQDSLDKSPALKQIADIQILDFICGNTGRRPENMLYQIDSDGRITGIVGTDNGHSFSAGSDVLSQTNAVDLDAISCISKSMADKVNSVSPDMIDNILLVNSLGQTEIAKTKERLLQLQNAIKSGAIPVKTDEELANSNLDDLIPEGKVNIFSSIKNSILNHYPALSPQQIRDEIQQAQAAGPDKNKEAKLNLFDNVDKTLFTQDLNPLGARMQELEDATRWVFFGSDKYEKVQTAAKELDQLLCMIQSDPHLANRKTIDLVGTAYKKVEDSCDAYIKYKTDRHEMTAEGKTGRRITAVNKLKEFCRNKNKALKYTRDLQAEKLEMQKEADRLKMDALNPETAIKTMAALNLTASKENISNQTKVKIGEELKFITTYLRKIDFKPAQLMMGEKDYKDLIKTAQENIAQGRIANAEIKKAEPRDLLAQELPGLDQHVTQAHKPQPKQKAEIKLDDPVKAAGPVKN